VFLGEFGRWRKGRGEQILMSDWEDKDEGEGDNFYFFWGGGSSQMGTTKLSCAILGGLQKIPVLDSCMLWNWVDWE